MYERPPVDSTKTPVPGSGGRHQPMPTTADQPVATSRMLLTPGAKAEAPGFQAATTLSGMRQVSSSDVTDVHEVLAPGPGRHGIRKSCLMSIVNDEWEMRVPGSARRRHCGWRDACSCRDSCGDARELKQTQMWVLLGERVLNCGSGGGRGGGGEQDNGASEVQYRAQELNEDGKFDQRLGRLGLEAVKMLKP
ncbi:hypothetical protein DFH08DRAFT_1055078 [Mycena albidolilacea]|uniref:Uncharacterized protein n=1 Tax=Mycena albidolilacea TaxID=1033008 RepID=A0AAD6Z2K7_9AGAR|nr:hypothetical protein DFH08DRAFT_1055078 [Mycena albidolilacea]